MNKALSKDELNDFEGCVSDKKRVVDEALQHRLKFVISSFVTLELGSRILNNVTLSTLF